MGCGREPRKSEKTFKEVFAMMPNLACCVWYGKNLEEDAKENVDIIKQKLDLMIEQMEAE
jgi:hypothetical protein